MEKIDAKRRFDVVVQRWNSGLKCEIQIMEIDRKKELENVGIGCGGSD